MTISPPSWVRGLPGGAVVEEEWSSDHEARLRITGELDAFDQNGLVDLLTGCFVDGARKVVIDAGGVRFADLDVIRTLVRLAARLERLGATVEILGLDRLRELLLQLSCPQLHERDL